MDETNIGYTKNKYWKIVALNFCFSFKNFNFYFARSCPTHPIGRVNNNQT